MKNIVLVPLSTILGFLTVCAAAPFLTSVVNANPIATATTTTTEQVAAEPKKEEARVNCRVICGKSLRERQVDVVPYSYEFTDLTQNKKKEWVVGWSDRTKFREFNVKILSTEQAKAPLREYFESVVPLASRTPEENKIYEAKLKAVLSALQSTTVDNLPSKQWIKETQEKEGDNSCVEVLSEKCQRAKNKIVYVIELGTY